MRWPNIISTGGVDVLQNPVIGHWWHPTDPNRKIPGMLTGSGSGALRLDLLEPLFMFREGDVAAILGSAGNKDFTLINPWYLGYRSDSESWGVIWVVDGEHLSWPDLKVKELAFRMEGLQDWSELTGLTKTISHAFSNPGIAFDFRYERADAAISHIDDVQISVAPLYTYPMSQWGVKFVEDSAIVVSSENGRTLTDWIELFVRPLQRFIQFGTHRRGRVWSVGIAPFERGGSLADVHGMRIEDAEGTDQPIPQDPNVVYGLSDLRSNGDQFFQTWFTIYEERRDSFDAYADEHFGPNKSVVNPGSFFSAARLLEQFKEHDGVTHRFSDGALAALEQAVVDHAPEEEHQALLAELPKLRRRASNESMARFIQDRQDVLDEIGLKNIHAQPIGSLFAVTRNYEAHHNPKHWRRAAKGYQLIDLTAFCTVLIDIELMTLFGIDKEKIGERLQHDDRLYYCRRLNREVVTP